MSSESADRGVKVVTDIVYDIELRVQDRLELTRLTEENRRLREEMRSIADLKEKCGRLERENNDLRYENKHLQVEMEVLTASPRVGYQGARAQPTRLSMTILVLKVPENLLFHFSRYVPAWLSPTFVFMSL